MSRVVSARRTGAPSIYEDGLRRGQRSTGGKFTTSAYRVTSDAHICPATIGADVRPNSKERPERETLTGKQWRDQ